MPDQDGQPTSAESRATIARLAAETLPRLIERLTKSDLGELEVREDGWRIRLRRPVSSDGPVPSGPPAHAAHRSAHPPSGPSSTDRPAGPTRVAHTPRAESSRGVVTSPAVGYFATRDGLAAGGSVRRGDVLGHVDVLGVRHEVVSPADGILRGVDVEAGQAVEYGQPIARVEANV